MDTDYADDLGLLVNSPAQTECLQHSSEQTSRGIGSYLNSDKKKEFMSFK